MAFNPNLYPSEIFNNPLKPYVYFLSLPDEILNSVAKDFNRDLTSIGTGKNSVAIERMNGTIDLNSIDQAFAFLKEVILTERGKEEAFLEYLKDKTKTHIDLKYPSIEEDWKPFVKEIQQILDFGNSGLTDLKLEYERLKANQKKFNNELKKNPDIKYIHGIADQVTKVSNQLKDIINFFSKDFSSQTNAYKIIHLIITRYKDDLLEFNANNQLVLKEHELNMVLDLISIQIVNLYNSNQELFMTNNGMRFNENTMNEFLNQNTEIDQDIQNMIKNIKRYPMLKNSIKSSLHLDVKRDSTINIKKIIHNNQLIDDTDTIISHLKSVMNGYRIPEDAIELYQSKPAFAEIQSMAKMIVTGALAAYNTGSSQAKPDNVIGYIAIDPQRMNPNNNPNIQNIIKSIQDIQKKIDDFVKTLKQTNTTQYYQDQAHNWEKLTNEINQILNKIDSGQEFLSSCFLIEDSTKNYVSLYASQEGNELATGPHGGSLGANLTDQLNKIEALTSAGGISMIDKQWLTAAIINSADNMIAGKLRHSIEDYLALFAAILLFDSQINIAQDALRRANFIKTQSSVHQIHLFSVNNGYYPLSYVLKLTYDHLLQGLGKIQEETRQGVQVEIFGHIKKPIIGDNPEDSWNATAQAALASTKIKMRFLVHLASTISDLLSLN